MYRAANTKKSIPEGPVNCLIGATGWDTGACHGMMN